MNNQFSIKIKFIFLLITAPLLLHAQIVKYSVWESEADSLIQTNQDLIKKRDIPGAFSAIQKAEGLCDTKRKKKSEKYALILMHTGRTHLYNGEYSKAEIFYLKAKQKFEHTTGKKNTNYITCLNHLGTAYYLLGDFEKAILTHTSATEIGHDVLGIQDETYAKSVNLLGGDYIKMGQYEKAEILISEANSIFKEIHGSNHQTYANSLTDLAILYHNMGAFEKAEPLYLEVIDIYTKNRGENHTALAGPLNNLAVLYDDMGIYQKAEPLYLKAKNKWGEKFGNEHRLYAKSLNNLAYLYTNIQEFEKAEKLYIEAIEIYKKSLEEDHPTYARQLNNLAILYSDIGRNQEAEYYFLKAIEIREKSLGSQHPDLAISFKKLAKLYTETKNYSLADSLYIRALNIEEQKLGKDHPARAETLKEMARLYFIEKNYKKSIEQFIVANNIEKSILEKSAHYLSDWELSAHIQTFLESQNLLFTLIDRLPAYAGYGYDNALFYKGFLMKTSQEMRKLALTSTAENRELYNLLKSSHRRLAIEYSKPISERKNEIDIETEINELEKKLTRKLAGYQQSSKQISWKEIQTSLQPNEAAVEFIHFNISGSFDNDSILYAALLIQKNTPPQFIPLFEEKDIKKIISKIGKNRQEIIDDLYSRNGEQILQMIWKPVDIYLKNVQTVYFSPTGILHNLNIGALPINKVEVLSDKYRLVRLTSTRQLTEYDSLNFQKKFEDALLFGGIQFDPEINPTQELSKWNNTESENSYSPDFQKQKWDELPWTEVEAISIQAILEEAEISTHLSSGLDASEKYFKALDSKKSMPELIHFATHGFFFPAPDHNIKLTESIKIKGQIFKNSPNPMMRSGLIMAGANHAWDTGKAISTKQEDGILTAYEISQMDLRETDLIVLSACETGLGDIKEYEGVYGLQRAFKIAGAKYIIMSLWQVPDFQTQELMTEFYLQLLIEEKNIPDAFMTAQKTIRQKYDSPYHWAGFVLLR